MPCIFCQTALALCFFFPPLVKEIALLNKSLQVPKSCDLHLVSAKENVVIITSNKETALGKTRSSLTKCYDSKNLTCATGTF